MLTNEELALQIQLANVTQMLQGKVAHYWCSDHTGKRWRKIEIIYDDRQGERKSSDNPDAG